MYRHRWPNGKRRNPQSRGANGRRRSDITRERRERPIGGHRRTEAETTGRNGIDIWGKTVLLVLVVKKMAHMLANGSSRRENWRTRTARSTSGYTVTDGTIGIVTKSGTSTVVIVGGAEWVVAVERRRACVEAVECSLMDGVHIRTRGGVDGIGLATTSVIDTTDTIGTHRPEVTTVITETGIGVVTVLTRTNEGIQAIITECRLEEVAVEEGDTILLVMVPIGTGHPVVPEGTSWTTEATEDEADQAGEITRVEGNRRLPIRKPSATHA